MTTRTALLFLTIVLAPSLHARQGASPSPSVPEWARRAVWYRIVPDRFYNGDATNDPKAGDVAGLEPRGTPTRYRVSNWTADWNVLQTWELADTALFPFWETTLRRRCGGDLQGVIAKLDYIARLGANAISFTPLFESGSLMKFDASTFHHIDNNLGPDPQGDTTTWSRENPAEPSTWRWSSADKLFLKFIKEAHKRNIRVMLDLDAGRVGTGFWAYCDVRLHGDRSAFAGWFALPPPGSDHRSIAGPEEGGTVPFQSDSTGLASGPRVYLEASMRRWMDPDGDGNPMDGVDGWKFIDPQRLPAPFWHAIATTARAINPEVLLTYDRVSEDGLFISADAVHRDRSTPEPGECAPEGDSLVSHDPRTGSATPCLHHAVDYAGFGRSERRDQFHRPGGCGANAEHRLLRGAARQELAEVKLSALWQMMAEEAPMLLYGDEAGMWEEGGSYRPMLWGNFIFADEAHFPGGRERKAEPVAADMRLSAYYRSLIQLRTAHEALCVGTMTKVFSDEARHIDAFLRSAGRDRVLIVLNTGAREEPVSIPLDLLGGSQVRREVIERNGFNVDGGKLEFLLRPMSGNVFLLEP